jgi:outer membrane protein assembly factor BamB
MSGIKALLIVLVILTTFSLMLPFSVYAAYSEDDWPMFLHDAAHSGVTVSEGATELSKLWSYREPDSDSAFVSSAAVVNDMVYVGSYHVDGRGGNIYAFNAYTGVKLWNYSTQSPVNTSPAVSGNTVFVGAGLDVLALDASTGAKIWNYTTKGFAGYSSFSLADGVVYVASEDDVYALDASAGIKIWNYTTGVAPYGSHGIGSSPAVADGIVYVSAGDSNIYALNASTGAKVWNYSAHTLTSSSPAVSNGVVYVGSGDSNVYALNALTGKKIWDFETLHYSKLGGIEASPAVTEGVVYIGSEGGGLYALNASSGSQIWNRRDFDTVYSSAAVSNGVVYIESKALNASTGDTIWDFPAGNTHASPAISNGVVYIGSANGTFYAIGEPIKTESLSLDPEQFFILWIAVIVAVFVIAAVGLLVYLKNRKS